MTTTPLRRSAVPLYYQLKEWLTGQIERGTLAVGQQLPSEEKLCEQFGISRPTVREALNDLVAEGKIRRIHGRGTFVAPGKVDHALAQHLTGLHDDLAQSQVPFATRVLEAGVMPGIEIGERIPKELGTARQEEVVFLRRLRLVEEEPLVVSTSYLPARLCPAILEEDFSSRSLYHTLEERYGLVVHRLTRTMEMRTVDEPEASWLGISRRAPVHSIENRAYLEDGRMIEYAEMLFRADRSRFVFEHTK
jgi:GntR family transcriptional regulator